MKSLVTVRRCNDYEPESVGHVVEQLFSDLGGVEAFVERGERILLKPNLLLPSRPEKAVVTHPKFVEAVASVLLDAGAKLGLGDSPPIGRLGRTLAKAGYEDFMKRMGIEPVPFVNLHPVTYPEDRLYRRINLAAEVFEFDAVINLAKLKTHSQMFLTLAVKNLFGVIVGADKATWHLHAGADYGNFARVLVQILEAVKPRLSIVDGVLGMEGDGPSGGRPRHVGIVAASRDAVALDATLCRLLGFQVERLRTCVLGESAGLGVADPERIHVIGDDLDGFPLKDFAAPSSMTMAWNLSSGNLLRRFLEKNMIPRPRMDHSTCTRCRTCLDHCPPEAISEKNGKMIVDYDKCISCFCCHELCPEQAVQIVQPIFGRMLARLTR